MFDTACAHFFHNDSLQAAENLRDTNHHIDNQRVDIGDNCVGYDAVCTDTAKNCTVKKKYHQTRTKLRHAISKTDGDKTFIKPKVKLEFPQTKCAFFAEKMD